MQVIWNTPLTYINLLTDWWSSRSCQALKYSLHYSTIERLKMFHFCLLGAVKRWVDSSSKFDMMKKEDIPSISKCNFKAIQASSISNLACFCPHLGCWSWQSTVVYLRMWDDSECPTTMPSQLEELQSHHPLQTSEVLSVEEVEWVDCVQEQVGAE